MPGETVLKLAVTLDPWSLTRPGSVTPPPKALDSKLLQAPFWPERGEATAKRECGLCVAAEVQGMLGGHLGLPGRSLITQP